MAQRVNRVRTQISEAQMAKAIIEAWRDLFNTIPTKEQVSLILAQNALETGHRKSMYNYNVGNITTSGKSNYDYFDDLTTDEQIKPGVWEKKNLKYRAYPSLIEGTKDYLRFLSSKKYAQAWQHILNPNPTAFSKALKSSRYYTANEKPYTAALTKLYSQIGKSNSYELAKVNKTKPNEAVNSIQVLLDKFLKQVAAMDNRKLYKKYLPRHHATILVQSNDRTNALEFARILSLALHEDLYAMASVHGDDQVEVECIIPGPEKECFAAIEQLTNSLAEIFIERTNKIDGVSVKTKVFTNKTSSYQPINLSTIEMEHRKFLLKLV